MTKYLIVRSDVASGRGTRGLNLYWFLSAYHGRRAVRLISTDDLRRDAWACDVLLLGVPTHVTKEELTRVRFRRAALFDYQDASAVLVNEGQEFLASLTDRYLKAWVEPGFDARWKWGTLPVRRHARLMLCLKYLRMTKRLRGTLERTHDVCFIGSPSGFANDSRVLWLREIRAANARFGFFGGFVGPEKLRQRVEEQSGGGRELFFAERMSFNTYFRHLRRARVALTPPGNARWTYRQYETLYSGAIPVSSDMRQARMLIPLPVENMVHVPDGGPVLPSIEEALVKQRRNPELAEANIAFLERYLRDGDYTKSKPELMDRFDAQLG